MRNFKRLLALMLSVVLVITLIPPTFGQANTGSPTLEILSPSGSNALPDQITNKFVDLVIRYSNIRDEDLNKIYFEVRNLDTGITREVRDSVGQPVQGATRQLRFPNVELTEGKNEISVLFRGVSLFRPSPVYVVFTEVTTISELKIDNRNFTNGIFVPLANPDGFRRVSIDGIAQNAEYIRAFSTIDREGKFAQFFNPYSGQFFFSAGDDQSEFQLRPGDNHFEIVASNAFKEFRVQRHFYYNDGSAFLYNTRFATGGTNLSYLTNDFLINQQTLQATENVNNYVVPITTDVKINLINSNLEYNTIVFAVNGDDDKKVTLTPNGNTYTAAVTDKNNNPIGNSQNLQYTQNQDYVRLTGLTVPINIDTTVPDQNLFISFSQIEGVQSPDVVRRQSDPQTFRYFFANTLAPYVDSAVFVADGEIKELTSGVVNPINYAEFAIEVYAKQMDPADTIELFIGEQTQPIGPSSSSINATTKDGVFRFNLNNTMLNEGINTIRLVPRIGNPGSSLQVGARTYTIRYNPAPYVYLTNMFNGQAFDINATVPYRLVIKPVNLQLDHSLSNGAAYPIRITFNDAVDMVSGLDKVNVTNGDVTKVDHFNFEFGQNHTRTQRRNMTLAPGLNTIIIEVFNTSDISGNAVVPGAKPISTFRYEIFVYDSHVPEVTSLDITDTLKETGKYTRLEGMNFRYYTQENNVSLRARIQHATRVRIVVNTFNHLGAPITREATFNREPNSSTFNFGTGDSSLASATLYSSNAATFSINNLALHGTGTTTIEVIAENQAGLYNSRMMEIVREPALFIMRYPAINAQTGKAPVNGNFSRVYIEAEGADRIIYGRNEVALPTASNSNLFIFEVKDLKRGDNRINLTIVRGSREDKAQITLANIDTPTVGAQHKASISDRRIRAFNNTFDLTFPRGTVLQLNNPSASNRLLSDRRNILVGIADPVDGRVNKIMHPYPNEPIGYFPTNSQWTNGPQILQELTGRFRKASHMFWVDGGTLDAELANPTLFNGGIYPYERGFEFYRKNSANYNRTFVPSQPGELTLSYDPHIVQSAWRYMTVFHYGMNETAAGTRRYEWKNIGGIVNQRNNTITVPFYDFGYYVVMYMDRSFDDITGHGWARDYLDTLYSKGIMRNKESNRFVTNEPITRGEFATLLVKAYSIPLDYEGQGTFWDVMRYNPSSSILYEYKYIETAARKGIIRGQVGGRFMPDSPITREDAAVMIARAANMKLETNLQRSIQRLERDFTDVHNVGNYAAPSIQAVAGAGLISGKPNVLGPGQTRQTFYFDPKANLTRAEAGAIIMRVLHREKRIPHT